MVATTTRKFTLGVPHKKDLRLTGVMIRRPLLHDSSKDFEITVSGNWRVTFTFEGEDAFDVDFEDYH